MKYNVVKPTIQKSVYNPTDEIELLLSFPGEEYVAGSWAVSMDVNLQETNGTPIADATELYIDSAAGAHGFLGLERISFQTSGDVYTSKFYARVYKMHSVCNTTRNEQVSKSTELCQLKASDDSLTNKMLNALQSVYLKPSASGMNSVSGNIRSDKTGTVKIAYKIEDLVKAVFGPGATAANSLQISNVEGHYNSIPLTQLNPKAPPTFMKVMQVVDQKVNTGNAVFNTNISSGMVSAMSCSFLPIAYDNVFTNNQLQLSEPPNIKRVQWSFNNALDQYIEYPIETREEMLQGFVESMGGDVNRNNIDSVPLDADPTTSNFGLGLKFNGTIDLRNKTIGLQIDSDITSANPYYLYMVFTTYIAL